MNGQYLLLTAAKDEEVFVGEAIRLVVRQTMLPVAWFIIDDGSTDRTETIVRSFADKYPFIRLQPSGSRNGRNFGSQYKALQEAYELARPLEFEFVAVQDADAAPECGNYYESLLGEFHRSPRLGIASGIIHERRRDRWEPRPHNSQDSASGNAIFRRTAFEQVGGYTPLVYGGSDWLIQLQLKMNGWELLIRPDLHMLHFRETSSAGGIWRGRFREGMMHGSFGSRPVFEFLKCCRRVNARPFLFGTMACYAGFLWWMVLRRKPLLNSQEIAFLRSYQTAKMRKALAGLHSGLQRARRPARSAQM